MKQEIRARLEQLSEKEYSEFTNKLVPGSTNVLGIRLPVLRALAKELLKDQPDLLPDSSDDFYYEEKLLRGIIIASSRLPIAEKLRYTAEFIPAIDNWAVCDSFCSSMKCPKKDKAVLWDFVQPYIYSDKEFEQRFAAVIMLGQFVNEEYIDRTLKALTEIPSDRYYSSMAVAWAAAECYIKFPERTEPYLSTEYLDRATLERTIRKLCDSFRVTAETKTRLKDLLKVE